MTAQPTGAPPDDRLRDLLDHLLRVTPLGPEDAKRVVTEVLAYLDEPVERFVRRRHSELQRANLANAAIYRQIATELRTWRFAAPELTERQIRRLVYG